jgi:hypothetical protein
VGIIEELRLAIEKAWENREDEGCGCCSGGGEEASRIEALEKARLLVELLTGKKEGE